MNGTGESYDSRWISYQGAEKGPGGEKAQSMTA